MTSAQAGPLAVARAGLARVRLTRIVRVFAGFDLGVTGCLGEPQQTPEAVPRWTPLAAIPWDEMWADDRFWLPLLLAGDDVDGRFLFDGDALRDQAVESRPRRAARPV